MKIYNLPDNLTEGTVTLDEVIIRHYSSRHITVKNKIILNRNMINLQISGSKTIVYAGTTITVAEGKLVILSTGNILATEVISGQQDFSSVLLYFNNEILNRFRIKYNSKLAQLHSENVKQPYLIYSQDAFIRQYVQSLLLLLKSPIKLSAEIKRIKLEELLLYLLHLDSNKLQSLRTVTEGQEEIQLKETVESHIGQPVTVEELAFLCNMSSSTFKRNFNRMYGTSPQRWLLNKKMLLAAELLMSPSAIPSQLYYKVGYQSHSSFSSAFRQHFGLSPSKYHAHQLNVLR